MKNLLQFKWPVVGARNEFEACQALNRANITAPIPAAFAQSGGSIASQRSFVLCDELTQFETLEDVANAWLDNPPNWREKRHLLYAVAQFAKRFHAAGLIHRDFYLCHLLISRQALAELGRSCQVQRIHLNHNECNCSFLDCVACNCVWTKCLGERFRGSTS